MTLLLVNCYGILLIRVGTENGKQQYLVDFQKINLISQILDKLLLIHFLGVNIGVASASYL